MQARPITTYNKIPKEFLTEPNERRQLYLDATLAVQGFDKPLSALGISIFRVLGNYMGIKILGSYNFMNLKKSAFECIGGKMILNLSNIMTKLPKDALISHMSNFNRVIPETIQKYGEQYKNETVCYEIDVSKIGMAWRLPVKRLIFCNYYSQTSKEYFDYYMDEFMKENDKYVDDNLDSNIPILDILEKITDEFTNNFRDYILPVMYLGVVQGYSKIRDLFGEHLKNNQELSEDLNNLTKAMPFITIQMGLDLYKLTKYLNKNEYINKTQDEFYQDYLNKKFQKDFYSKFEEFLKKYGFRGEGEFDIINERYYDNPKTVLNQIYFALLKNDENHNPQKDFDDTNAKRPQVFKKLLKFAETKGFSSDLVQSYKNMMNFFHYRESPKYYLIFVIGKMRKLILHRAKILLDKHLINDINDIFKLNINNLSEILKNVGKYTKEKIENIMKKDCEINEIFEGWKRAPILFDSRGRIFFQEKKVSNKKNELIGDTVSFGKIRGKAKVLNYVNEKEFNPGEILITKATDPGWTPLIINCGGIVLEVGGMLQHGALVSREFNKPCVVGIENVTQIIKDGEEVEVDAIEGVVRLLDREE